ncbi:MAG: thiamine pyrophosphate-binding protein [Chloroflexota bacterium]
MSEMKTGGQIIWESLIHEGVDVVFGLPGGAILPTYDDLYKYDYPIHHVLVTHEHGAHPIWRMGMLGQRDGSAFVSPPPVPERRI